MSSPTTAIGSPFVLLCARDTMSFIWLVSAAVTPLGSYIAAAFEINSLRVFGVSL